MKRSAVFVLGLLLSVSLAAKSAVLIPSGQKDHATEEANRALVLDFWKNFFSGKMDQWATWLAPDFVNHDPYEPSGGQAFAAFVKANDAKRPRQAVPTLPRSAPNHLFVMADGDLVLIVHPGSNPADLTENVHGNIVRVKNGKITDWWLVGQLDRSAEPKPQKDNKAGIQPLPLH